jgi:hypothetical protein
MTQPPRPAPRRCVATSKNGQSCKAYALRDEELCAGHAGRGLAANSKAAASQSAVRRQTQAQVRKKRAIDIYRDAVEEHAEDFIALRLAAVKDTSLPMSERLKAAEQLENRGMGKPKETLETKEISEAEQWMEGLTTNSRPSGVAFPRAMEARTTSQLLARRVIFRMVEPIPARPPAP